MLIVGFRGTNIKELDKLIKNINKYNIGGIILFDIDNPSKSFPRNIINKSQLKKLISDIKNKTRKDLLISIDLEGEKVNRLKPKYGFEYIKSQNQVAKEGKKEAHIVSKKIAKELKEMGINLNFAPSVDVNINPNNPIIGKIGRSFSSNPKIVGEFANIYIKNFQKKQIIPVIKHFPGHGSSNKDSHLGLVDLTQTYKEKELLPFKSIIENNYKGMIMTAHIMNKNIDKNFPATLSKKFIEGKLRKTLKFEGVVVSDDMAMGAIVNHFGFDNALTLAINAGCDMLVLSNNGKNYDDNLIKKAVNSIYNSIKKEKISIKKLEQANKRIKILKETFIL